MRLDSSRASAVLARVRATPEGFVRAYGDVSPGAPRFGGAVLAASRDPSLPWHRIVRADGSLATHPPDRQRALLEAEGVPFVGARVDMHVARLPPDAEILVADDDL
jgi:methylated-DNA-protein-cysteine methyltransferase-like protein